MRKRRRILYQICGIFLGISCMLSACHEKEETFTSVAAVEADAGDKKNEAESKAAEEKPDKEKADPGGEEKEAAGQVYLNQAAHLTDGQRIYVPSREEEQTLKEEDSPSDMADAGMEKDTGIINLNTATKAELLSLSGIGESRAEAIIAYRETNGGFRKIEDLKKVDGIKEGIFQKIREQITVE